MKKQKKLLLLIIIASALFLAGYYLNRNFSVPKSTEQLVTQEQKTTLTVDVSGQKQSFDISQFVGKSALEATLASLDVEATGTGENAFVTSINKRKADSNSNEFWELVLNGSSAQVGAGSYTIVAGDTLEWRINTY